MEAGGGLIVDVSGGQLESSGGVWVVRVGGQVGGAGCIGGVECTLCQRRNGMLVIVSNGCHGIINRGV